jgi:hypothetical protein
MPDLGAKICGAEVDAIIRGVELPRQCHVICRGNPKFDAWRHGLWRRDMLPRRRELRRRALGPKTAEPWVQKRK